MSALSRMAAILGIAKGAPNPFEMVQDAFCGTNRSAEKNRKKNIANRKRKAQKAARRRNRR